jgi:eukaryotic-like serine/threonine-protein kinase
VKAAVERDRTAGGVFDGLLKEAKLLLQSDPEFAVKYYPHAIKRAARKHGPHANQTLNLRQAYAVALSRNGANEKAEAELTALIARRELMAGASDDAVPHAREWLRHARESHARVLYALGRFDEAESEWRELAAECDRLLGTHHPDAIDAHEGHAMTLARLDQVAEAEAEMAGVIQKREAAGGRDDAATVQARTVHAVYLDRLGRRAESEAAWRELAEANGRVLGNDHADTIRARERLAATLYDQRRLQEAAAEYGEVMVLRAAAQGGDHPDTLRARDWQAAIERELNSPRQDDYFS